MSIEIRCECGQRVRAEENQRGRQYPCPKCGRPIHVTPARQTPPDAPPPSRAISQPILALPQARTGPIDNFSQANKEYLESTGIGSVVLVYFVVWAVLFVATWACMAIYPPMKYAALAILAVGTIALGIQAFNLALAKARVLKKGQQPLLFGLLNLIAWNPTEGVVILKNKMVHYIDENLHDGGGIKMIYPVFGEEVALRVALEPQSLVFEDIDVLTKEYLPLHVRGTMKWRIVSLEHFYLLVSTELHEASHEGRPGTAHPPKESHASHDDRASGQRKLALAEKWLRWTAEEQARIVVSRMSTGLLVADQIAADLPPELVNPVAATKQPTASAPSASGKYQSSTDGLASRIYSAIAESVGQYGIEIHEVTLQEVRLPADIHRQCVEACKASYTPIIAQRDAIAKQLQLQAEADVMGTEALAAREVVGSAPAFSLVDFLGRFIANNPSLTRKPTQGNLPQPDLPQANLEEL